MSRPPSKHSPKGATPNRAPTPPAAAARPSPPTNGAMGERAAAPEIAERYLDWDGTPLPEANSALERFDPQWLLDLHSKMQFLRCLDERMLKLQRAGRIGFVGSMLGLEATLAGSALAIPQSDWLWSGLREGGAALLRGLPLPEYIAQMYCNGNDTAKGRQMCNHFQHKGTHYPSWSSVIGTQIPHGVGAAYATKLRGEHAAHAIYFGDGATSSNGFHSGLNMAAVWKVPAVFVCVNNHWAISVPSRAQTASATYAEKAKAYGLPGHRVDGNDPLAVHSALTTLLDRARNGAGPALLELVTYRMMGHSSSDDPTKYRDPAEVAVWQKRDPLPRFTHYLTTRKLLTPKAAEALVTTHNATIDREIHAQESAPPMPLRSLVDDVYSSVPRHLRAQYNDFLRIESLHGTAQPGDGAFPL